MMIQRFTLVAVCLGAFSLSSATAVAQAPTPLPGAITFGAITPGATTFVATPQFHSNAHAARGTAPIVAAAVLVSSRHMSDTVAAGWWDSLILTVAGVVEGLIFASVASATAAVGG
jgi:hypothetical protein